MPDTLIPSETDAPAATEAPAAPPREPQIYLSKYRPLVSYERGLRAIAEYRIQPYVDASCRREPDLENPYPAISAIVHGAAFVTRLLPGDTVVCITAKGKYERNDAEHWRLTGVLKVIERFDTHEAAAAWYREKGVALPGNCMVDGNDPLPLAKTCGVYDDENEKEKVARSVEEWDVQYQDKAAECPVFVVCKPLLVRLRVAPAIWQNDVKTIFPNGRMPVARIPSVITADTLTKLLYNCNVSLPAEVAA